MDLKGTWYHVGIVMKSLPAYVKLTVHRPLFSAQLANGIGLPGPSWSTIAYLCI